MGCHSAVAGFTNKVPTLTRDTTPSSLGVCIYASTSHASRGWWPTDHTRGILDQTKAGGEQLQKPRSSFDHQNASRSTVISSRGHKTQSTACSLKGFTARPQLQVAAVQPWTHDAEASVEALPQHEVEVRHRYHHSLPGRNRQLQRLHCQQFRLHRPRLRLGLRWLRQPRRGTPDTPLTREVLRRRRPLLAW